MAIPSEARQFPVSMDPSDKVDFLASFSGLLQEGESILFVTLSLLPEAVALGFTVVSDLDHGPFVVDGNGVEFWGEIDPNFRSNSAFDSGASLPIEFSITTNAFPSRRFQRTALVRVINL